MDCIFASSNEHKAQEFSKLFDQKIIKIIPALDKVEVVENGKTYFENAELKARAYFKKYKRPVMSDDSGLDVEVMPNDLGLYSARFGGEGLDYNGKMDLLLKKLQLFDNRKACFRAVLCFYLSPEEVFFYEGRLEGEILYSKQGEGGFGYDPLFSPSKYDGEKSLAELPQWKEVHSHRAQAAKMAEAFFSEYRNDF